MAAEKITDVQKWINIFKNKREDMLLSYPNLKIPEVGSFTEGFGKYIGQGHFLYVFTNSKEKEDEIVEIMNRKNLPLRAMVKELYQTTKIQAIILDAEMGSMTIYEST